MRISELSRLSGVPTPKIHRYIRQGVLPKPVKAKATSAYYSDQHLERLKLIEKITRTKNPSPPLLKKLIDSVNHVEGAGQAEHPDADQILRDKIVSASIPIFRRNGYEGARIREIAEAAGVSPNTFYQAFKNKQEVLIECLNRIFLDWRKETPPEGTMDTFSLMKKMFSTFYKAFPQWIHMLNLFRAAASKHPEVFAEKLEKSLSIRIQPIVDDTKKGIAQGVFRDVNAELVGVIIAGITEYVSYYMLRGKFMEPPDDIIAQSMDIVFRGLASTAYRQDTEQNPAKGTA